MIDTFFSSKKKSVCLVLLFVLSIAPFSTGEDASERLKSIEDLEAAIVKATKNLASQPENPNLLFSLGRWNMMTGHYERAEQFFKMARDIDPQNLNCLLILSQLYRRLSVSQGSLFQPCRCAQV